MRRHARRHGGDEAEKGDERHNLRLIHPFVSDRNGREQ
jgi:hypothetical protein